jgi:DMSO reductase anchor subunit
VWNSRRTLVAFFAATLSLGPLFALFCLDRAGVDPAWIVIAMAAAATGTLVQLGVFAHLLATIRRRADRQHRGTGQLLRERFRVMQAVRFACAGAGLLLLLSATTVPLAGAAAAGRLGVALVMIALGELLGRYLFYVTVVPHGTAGGFAGRA